MYSLKHTFYRLDLVGCGPHGGLHPLDFGFDVPNVGGELLDLAPEPFERRLLLNLVIAGWNRC